MSPEYIQEMAFSIILPGLADTVYMVGISSLISVIIGTAVGILLFVTAGGGIMENPVLNQMAGAIVNIGRSIPFVIIIIAVFPLSKFIVGASIGKTAAIVPLTIAAIPFVARIMEGSLNEIGRGVIEAAIASGASEWQIIFRVLIPETAHSMVTNITVTVINLIGYSAMAGTIGGGGLGDVAIRYGYQRFRNDVLFVVVVVLILLVQIIQLIGGAYARRLDKR